MQARVRLIGEQDKDEWLRMRLALWGDEDPDDAEDSNREIETFFALHSTSATAPASTAQAVAEHLPVAVFVGEAIPAGEDAPPPPGLCGFLEMSIRPYAEGCEGPTPYIEGWYVDAPFRGQGIGRALVSAAEAWARGQGSTELASDAELENRASLAAHLALGFEEAERLVVFRKTL